MELNKIIGPLIILLGAVMLVVSFFEPSGKLVDSNYFVLAGVCVIVLGVVAHIFAQKYWKK